MLLGNGEIKKIKAALNRAMVQSCPITYRNQTRMLKAVFIRICLKNQAARVSGWTDGQRGYSPAYPQCAACETGKLIAAGLDFPQPSYTDWIEDVEAVREPTRREPALFADMLPAMERAGMQRKQPTKEEIAMEKKLDNTPFKSLPEKLEGLRIRDLATHWRRAVCPSKQSGTCVNCGRPQVQIRQHGLCASCQNAAVKQRGQDLLDALEQIRERLAQPGAKIRSEASKALKRPVVKDVPVTPAGAEQPDLPLKTAAPARGDSEVILISPLAGLGSRYIKFGEMMKDMNTSLADLVSAAHELGLRVDVNVVVEK
ncbi:MAG: hypothetical protein ACOY32_15210 [Thermodesulfobacteriota bacterium]